MKTLKKSIEANCIMRLILMVIMLITLTMIRGQQHDNKTVRPIQISLITPIGSNGLQSPEVVNNFSLNLIAGYSGGVKGLEIAGFGNMIKGEMTGVQVAGFTNLVKGKTNGVEIAGFINLNKEEVIGTQIAGFSNIAGNNIDAVQVSSFLNFVNGNVDKGQITGFANIARKDVKATQIAGFINIGSGDVRGCQIAGFTNFAHEKVEGVQIAGFLNYTKRLKGCQIGVFNVADTVEMGVPIGVFSWVKNGYRSVEVSGSETIHGIVSFKTGTRNFYNIFSIGKITNGRNSWAVGYGVGTILPISKKFSIPVEAIAFYLNEDEAWTEELNMLNKANFSLSYQVNNYISLYGGVSINVAVSNLRDAEGKLIGSGLIPYYYYNKNFNRTNVKMYPGFNLGISLKL